MPLTSFGLQWHVFSELSLRVSVQIWERGGCTHHVSDRLGKRGGPSFGPILAFSRPTFGRCALHYVATSDFNVDRGRNKPVWGPFKPQPRGRGARQQRNHQHREQIDHIGDLQMLPIPTFDQIPRASGRQSEGGSSRKRENTLQNPHAHTQRACRPEPTRSGRSLAGPATTQKQQVQMKVTLCWKRAPMYGALVSYRTLHKTGPNSVGPRVSWWAALRPMCKPVVAHTSREEHQRSPLDLSLLELSRCSITP